MGYSVVGKASLTSSVTLSVAPHRPIIANVAIKAGAYPDI